MLPSHRTRQGNMIQNHLSFIAFLFLAFAIMSSGFVTQILSCQVQELLHTNIYVKHIIGYLLIYTFIMLEGGWSFDKAEEEAANTDWSNGNAFDSLVYALGLYLLFLLSAKMQLVPNIAFYAVLFVGYVGNTQRLYWHNRSQITPEQNEKALRALFVLTCTALIILVYGVIDYYVYMSKRHTDRFSWLTFILGKPTCRRLRAAAV